MKLVAFNGSPRKEGNTHKALESLAAELTKEGIEVSIIQVGDRPIRGCLACGGCAKNKNERCVINDEVNDWIQIMKAADGIVIASPVHFASIGATMKCFLDRAFYVSSSNGNLFRHKVGAALVAVRRSGGVAAYNQLNNYLLYAEMLIPGSNYWNVIHGAVPGEVTQDEEGMQTLRILAKNLAWLLKLKDQGRGLVPEPEKEPKVRTNFIR
ncbi:MAG TPA: flavodoxin family protein [Treponema sp.]|nr:flavodoxin family protein [Treponema sp.]